MAYLEVRRSEGLQVVPLTAQRSTIGRAETNTLAFPGDDAMSREHAAIELDQGDWRVRDLGSANGTYLNGERLQTARMLS